jgi:hypothetical protein
MAEDSENQSASNEVFDAHGPDWYLQALVELVNGSEAQFPITVFSNGLIVSGQLVGGNKYFDALKDQYKQFLGQSVEDIDQVVAYLTKMPSEIYTKTDQDKDKALPVYIHIENAQVFVPGETPIPNGGMWWRGKLTDINAFSFGKLTLGENGA